MIKEVVFIAQEAGKILLSYYRKNVYVSYKDENKYNTLTKADLESDAYIHKKLNEIFPGYQIVSEERPAKINHSQSAWIVDPLDGTNPFIRGEKTFCVMIGLLKKNLPELGVIHFPALKETYYARRGHGAFLLKGKKRYYLMVSEERKITRSRAFIKTSDEGRKPLDNVLIQIPILENLKRGSAGYNIMHVAKGDAEFYINADFRAHIWDVCAPQVILEEAGGKMTTLSGNKIDYKTMKLKEPFMASNGMIHESVIKLINNYKPNNSKT